MEILCASDLHGDFDTLKKIAEAAQGFDTLLLAGDITNFSSSKIAGHMVRELEPLVENLFLVPGNCEIFETSTHYQELGVSLHGMGRVVEDIGFFGLGGSNLTPFKTPLEYREEDITRTLEAGFEMVKASKIKVLVSHPPPKGALDTTSDGLCVGSSALRDFLEENDVDLIVCGHVHEAKGYMKLGGARVINTGPAREGFVRVSIEKNGSISHDFI
jgi:Icc-related predicted phosphoesterase